MTNLMTFQPRRLQRKKARCPFTGARMKRRRSSVAGDGDGSRMTSAVSVIERRLTFTRTTCMTEDKTEIEAKRAKRYLVNFHILILSLNSKCYRISPDTHPARGCRCTGRELKSHRGIVRVFFLISQVSREFSSGFVLPRPQMQQVRNFIWLLKRPR